MDQTAPPKTLPAQSRDDVPDDAVRRVADPDLLVAEPGEAEVAPEAAEMETPQAHRPRQVLEVSHRTTYRYAAPVKLGTQRLMLRPRDSHDMRLLDASLTLSPPGTVRWVYDVFGNSIALVDFADLATELVIRSDLLVERFETREPARDLAQEIARHAQEWPFTYSEDDLADLGVMRVPQYADPDGRLRDWTQGFVAATPTPTLGLLMDVNSSIHDGFTYRAREEAGTQTPLATLDAGSGTCRDFSVLMIEACRTMGFGARLISGYLHAPEAGTLEGAGATHAWCEVYLPQAGWISFDPTNGLVGGSDLIRVATVRDIHQAAPISGSFTGRPTDFIGMDVSVTVKRVEEAAADGVATAA